MQLKRIQGIDGLKAIAILAITFYHFFPSIVKGGYLGVCLFFILSGFLISLKPPFPLWTYAKKRIKRIYPGLLLMFFFTIGFYFFFCPEGIQAIRNEGISILTGWNNWWQIGQNANYFTRIANASMFTPMWFLSIEMQFYLIWPFLHFAYQKIEKSKGFLFAQRLLLALIFFSGIWMLIQYHPNQDVTRLYYGTDTRLFSILMGVYLGMMVTHHKIDENEKSNNFTIFLLFVFMFVCFFVCDGQAAYMYCGGFFGISMGMSLLFYALLHMNRWTSLLEWKPLKWIGQYSYELFLWQYPILYFFQTKHWQGPFVLILEFVLLFLFAYGSHTILSGPRKNWKKELRIGLNGLLVFFCFFGMLGFVQSKGQKESTSLEKTMVKNQKALKKQKKKKVKVAQTISIENVYCVGDSVMLGSVEALQEQLPNCQVNAEVSRHIGSELESVQEAINAGQVGKVVVVSLGTNGPLYEQPVNDLLNALGSDREIFWVNVYGPYLEWQDDVNQTIDQLAKTHKNVHKVDWYSLIKDHPEWLTSDGIHPEVEGQNAYAQLIRETIEKTKS